MKVLGSFAVAALILAAAAAPAVTVPAPADTAWSLADCVQTALTVSPVLAGGRAQAEAAREGVSTAGAGRLPVVGLSGSSSYTTETMRLNVPSLAGPHSIAFGDGTSTDLMLGLRAPLFEGGKLQAKVLSARARWRASVADVAADSLDLRLQVRQAFYAALGSEAAARAASQGEARLRRHLAEIEANIAAGMASEEDHLQVLARLRRAEQTTVGSQAEAAARRYLLGRLVGRPGMQIHPLADLDVSLLTDDATSRPLNERPELRALDARLDATGHSVREASGSRWPAVDLEGGWHYGKPGIDPVTNQWMNYGTVAVNLRWTLFDFGSRRSRVMNLQAQGRALAAARDDVDDALRTRQANALTQVQAARMEADWSGQRLDLERQRLSLAHERWRQGHATESELLDAEDDVTLAAADQATAQARLRRAEAELLAARGW